MRHFFLFALVILLGCDNDSESVDAVCGNGVIEDGEECDNEALSDTCQGLGFERGGTLICNIHCRLDTSDCDTSTCGDKVLQEEFEECEDGVALHTTCQELGFYGGILKCNPDLHS